MCQFSAPWISRRSKSSGTWFRSTCLRYELCHPFIFPRMIYRPAQATEQPEGTEEFVELHEGNSAGRRGGQTAAGGFAWAAASGNRAGNVHEGEGAEGALSKKNVARVIVSSLLSETDCHSCDSVDRFEVGSLLN